MPHDKTDTDKTDAENKANAEEIKDVDHAEPGPRGNVHSEAEEDAPRDDPPPPMPN